MDYKSIYDQFITDRRLKERALIDSREYLERHHVIPRSRGGDNSPENLICLTPEDHYFAHLLLARIYGGVLWACLFLLDTRRRELGSSGRPRAIYGGAKRALSELLRGQEGRKGESNGMYKGELLDWFNLDTRESKRATMWDMWSEYGGSRGQWTMVVKGERSMLGWVLEQQRGNKRGFKGKSFDFINRDGREFAGTQQEFAAHTGCSLATASRICRGASVSRDGWRLKGTEDRFWTYSKTGKPGKLGAGKTYHLEKHGVHISGKRAELAERLDATPAQVSAGINLILRGKMASYKGWRLIKVE